MSASIKASIRKYLSSNNITKSISIKGLHNHIIKENPNLVGITRKQDRVNSFFDRVYVERNFATAQRLSVREELLVKEYSLDTGEFAAYGSCEINVEVIS